MRRNVHDRLYFIIYIPIDRVLVTLSKNNMVHTIYFYIEMCIAPPNRHNEFGCPLEKLRFPRSKLANSVTMIVLLSTINFTKIGHMVCAKNEG